MMPKSNAGSFIATPVWPRSKLDGTDAREATYTKIVGARQRALFLAVFRQLERAPGLLTRSVELDVWAVNLS
jgi:hypothetical protein